MRSCGLKMTINNNLNNKTYTGRIVCNGMKTKGFHEPIISNRWWNRCNQMLSVKQDFLDEHGREKTQTNDKISCPSLILISWTGLSCYIRNHRYRNCARWQACRTFFSSSHRISPRCSVYNCFPDCSNPVQLQMTSGPQQKPISALAWPHSQLLNSSRVD